MQKRSYRKALVLPIIFLFVGISISPSSDAVCVKKMFSSHGAVLDVTKTSPRRIIYVDNSNIYGPWDGTAEHPYRHIQDAVDNASDGDTIYVKNSTCHRGEIFNKTAELLDENKNTLTVEIGNEEFVDVFVDGVKTLIFPLGTKIKQINGEDIEIRKAAGLKDGKHVLFLGILSKGKTRVRVVYELPLYFVGSADEYDFLIITHTRWRDLLEPLVKHKEKHGIRTIVVTLDEIYNDKYFDALGEDKPEKIKHFIKESVENWGIKYVMLVGGSSYLDGEGFIPVRYSWLNDRSSSWEYERCFISDLYYADIYNADGAFSSWDSNNNSYYAEYDHELKGKKLVDEVDLVPDVYLGRLPVRSRLELKRVVNNIIQYEDDPSTRFNKVVLCGGDSYPHDPWDIVEGEYLLDEISEQMSGYNVTKIYASQKLDPRMINDAINKGVGIVVFEGAGSSQMWGTRPKDNDKWIYYTKRDILQLKNRFLPIVLTSGARTGRFNGTKECFNWFFVSKGKAVASIGSTGLCWIGHGADVTQMFLGNLHVRLCKKIAEKKLLGDAWGEALGEYILNFTWQGVTKAFHMKAAEELEIFGDPTLKTGGYKECETKKSTMKKTSAVRNDGYVNHMKTQKNIKDANGKCVTVPGVYHEDLYIDKSLTIKGNGATIITDGITLFFSNITIERFHVEGHKKGDGLRCIGNNALIKNNTICFFNTSIFVSGDHCVMKGNVIRDSECGVWLDRTKHSVILDNNIKNNWYGIWGECMLNVTIKNNNFSYNKWYAVWMEGIHGDIAGNNFSKNWYSIYFYNSNYFSTQENIITFNVHGPQFVNSSFNLIKRNTIKNNEHYGIFFGWRSTKNEITYNNFIENTYNARDDGGNTWDNNYWSNYIGVKIKIFYLLHFPYRFKQSSFDRHPAQEPL